MALTNYNFGSDDLLAPFFGQAMAPRSGTDSAGVRGIPLDVIEKPNKFEILADVPGVDKKDIKLTVDGDVMSLTVQKAKSKEDEKVEEGVKVHRAERSSAFVRRSLRLPEHADLSKVSAKYENGVLRIEVPKADEKQRTRDVQVQ